MSSNPDCFQNARQTKLSETEKGLMRHNLLAFMQNHPVRVESTTRQLAQEAPSNFLSSLTSMFLKPLPITLSALLLLGGGTAFAAENALPNQPLYPIKIQVNERVRAALTPTVEGKAKWETEVAARRLDEAEKLAAENKLQAALQTEVASSFDAQAKLVQIKIDELKATGNTEAAAKLSTEFNALLQTHQTIVTQLISDTDVNQRTMSEDEKTKLDTPTNTENTDKAGMDKTDASTSASNDAQADLKLEAYKKQQTATTAITEAKTNMSAVTIYSAELKTKITNLLALSDAELSEGNTAYGQASFKTALSHYTNAQMSAEEASQLIKTTNVSEPKIDASVNTKIQLEENQASNLDQDMTNIKIDPSATQNLKLDAKY